MGEMLNLYVSGDKRIDLDNFRKWCDDHRTSPSKKAIELIMEFMISENTPKVESDGKPIPLPKYLICEHSLKKLDQGTFICKRLPEIRKFPMYCDSCKRFWRPKL